MKHEHEMQKYIEAQRAELQASAMRHEEEIEIQEAKNFTLKVWILISVGLTIWLGFSNINYVSENRQLKQSIDQMGGSELPQRFDEALNDISRLQARVSELKEANEQLIKHCKPCDVNNAIKSTKMPQLVRGV